MTKKKSSEMLADENREMFREKVQILKFSSESEIFSKIGGNLKQGEMHHGLRGDGRPCPLPPFHKSVHSSCPFDLGERPSCLLVLDSDEDVDYLQTHFFLPNLLTPLCR